MYTSSAIRILWRCTPLSRPFRSERSAVQSQSGRSGRLNIPTLITTQPSIVSRWLTSANSASNVVEPHSVITFASPSADCGACWPSMSSMIGQWHDQSVAGPSTSVPGSSGGRAAARADRVRNMDGAAQSALIVTIAQAEEAVALHRAQLDDAAAFGIPAHVTVLFPFMPPSEIDARVVAALAAAISTVEKFDVDFESTGWFGTNVLWLAPKPATSFGALTTAVADVFP